ncbi:MAG: TadE/TadG family type IV pilus assembly protein [Candidatus Sedimenticola sp. (ex Thyasira tokunagai)]
MSKLRTSSWIRHQQGSTMVEAAIIMALFLALVFAIIEFSIAMFKYEQSVEATRAGTRFAIVNDPVCDLFGDLDSAITDCPLDCAAGTLTDYVSVNCNDSGVECGSADPRSGLLGAMARMIPEIVPENVNLIYACSGAGYQQRPTPVPSITVSTSGLGHQLILPSLFDFEATWGIPPFSSTRLGEDLETVTP